jgi:anti-sigma factor RsiW
MTHDPERAAAAYLAGELSSAEAERYDRHLLECEACWREVQQAREGLLLAGQEREHAPPHLRERILAALQDAAAEDAGVDGAGVDGAAAEDAVGDDGGSYRSGRRPPAAVLTALGAVVVGILVVTVSWWPHPAQPPIIEAAVEAYVGARLPGEQVPSAPAPDLAELELVEVGASVGRLAGTPVTTFAYRQGGVEPLFVYVGERSFPTARDATVVSGADGAWIAQDGEVTILCAQSPRDLLIVGDDEALVRAVARALGVG